MIGSGTLWTAAAIGLLPPLAIGLLLCCKGGEATRLAAMQFAVAIGTLLLVATTFVLDQASSIDLALTFAFLGFPAALLFALFYERWL